MLRQAEAASEVYDITILYRSEEKNKEHWANGRFQTIFMPKAEYTPKTASMWRVPGFFYQELRVLRQLLQLNADIFHPHQHSSLLVTLLWILLTGKPVIFDPHDMHIHNLSPRTLQIKVKRWLESFIVQRASAVLVVSSGIQSIYQRKYPGISVYLLPNLPAFNNDLSIFNASTDNPQTGSMNNIIRLVYAGLIKPDRLPLELFKTIGQSHKPVTLDVLGFSPTNYDEIVARYIQAEGFNNIVFRGPYNEVDIIKRLRPYHYFILPFEITTDNIRYCMPNKIYQALAACLPIIASNMVEISRLVQNHQIGYIYPDGNYAALATILAQLDIIGDEYKEQRRRVSQAAAKMLNYSAYQEELLKAYETALA
jgi:glycosyltransferase involved in cell wall biosynthesis